MTAWDDQRLSRPVPGTLVRVDRNRLGSYQSVSLPPLGAVRSCLFLSQSKIKQLARRDLWSSLTADPVGRALLEAALLHRRSRRSIASRYGFRIWRANSPGGLHGPALSQDHFFEYSMLCAAS